MAEDPVADPVVVVDDPNVVSDGTSGASAGNVIRYQDLINISLTNILALGKNIGSYSSVPVQLQYPYTYSQAISVTSGNTPHVIWTNSSACAVVTSATVTQQFNDFCNTYLLTNAAHANSVITMSEAVRFLTAVFCFIQSKFFMVYSHLTATTAVFYRSDTAIDYSKVVTIAPFKLTVSNVQAVINSLCASALTQTSTLCAIEGYTLQGY